MPAGFVAFGGLAGLPLLDSHGRQADLAATDSASEIRVRLGYWVGHGLGARTAARPRNTVGDGDDG